MSISDVISSRFDASALLETPGTVLRLQGSFAVPAGLDIPLVTLPDTFTGDLVCEGLLEGVLVRGTVDMVYGVQCASCLTAGEQGFSADIAELYSQDEEAEEEFVIGPDLHIDLEPLWRDVIADHAGVRYLCRPDCKGLCVSCGCNRNAHQCACEDVRTDLRWQALAGLTFPEAEEAVPEAEEA